MSDCFNPINDVCIKCNGIFNEKWESKKTYLGIDEHHNPPLEISRFLKEVWKGELYKICRECHKNLHKEITNILKKYSSKPKYNNDYWLMKNSTIIKLKKAKQEIYDFTKEWLKIKKDGENKINCYA